MLKIKHEANTIIFTRESALILKKCDDLERLLSTINRKRQTCKSAKILIILVIIKPTPIREKEFIFFKKVTNITLQIEL